ncbi:MAG TPA: hypothetical protein VKM55_21985 [Candidatus Lokiarchaeia archaeon]|nr:hypothetical protein [Candidatus Lokiarchaeia archaeon]
MKIKFTNTDINYIDDLGLKIMQNLPPVDIVFNCWEKSYPRVLDESFILKICNQNHFKFKNIIVLINDVENRSQVEEIGQRLINDKIITDYFFVEDYEQQVYQKLGLTREELGYGKHMGFYYITNWVFILPFVAKSKYFVHWDENAELNPEGDWITPCLIELERNPKLLAGTPINTIDLTREESFSETDDFFIGFMFSDIVFLVNKLKFMQPIYNLRHFYSLRYHMSYIGNIFEMRVDSFMRYADLYRITSKKAVLVHHGPQGIEYPYRTFRERLKAFLYDLVYRAFQLIYNPKTNRYSIRPMRFIEQITKLVIKFASFHVKIRVIQGAIARVCKFIGPVC